MCHTLYFYWIIILKTIPNDDQLCSNFYEYSEHKTKFESISGDDDNDNSNNKDSILILLLTWNFRVYKASYLENMLSLINH